VDDSGAITRFFSHFCCTSKMQSMSNSKVPAKLFVGQVPISMDEPQLKAVFEPYGSLVEVAILRDRGTARHKGCAFVIYSSSTEADTAIKALDGQRVVLPQTNPLQVRYAESTPMANTGPSPITPALLSVPPLFPGMVPMSAPVVLPCNTRLGKKINHPCRGGRKVFVGQFPRSTTKEELQRLFEEFGTVEEVFMFKDKLTGQAKGAAFVLFDRPEEADAAIDGLHNKRTIPPMKNYLQVKHADGEVPPLGEPKLFVGMIPFRATDEEVRNVFQQFGKIAELTILHKSSGQSQGAGFVRFETCEECDAAIAALDGKHRMQGSPNPLMVRYAASPKPKSAKLGPDNKMHQSQQAAWLQVYIQQLSASAAATAAAAAAAGANPYQVAAMQSAYLGTLSSLMAANPHSLPHPVVDGTSAQKKTSGPPGANLFVLHLPPEWSDIELLTAFSPFGTVVSTTVFRDRATGASKGFGFVSYSSPVHAKAAIAAMNNYPVGNVRLLVQLKTEKQTLLE